MTDDLPRSNARSDVEEWLDDTYRGYDLDVLTKTVYEVRSQTREPYSDERWQRLKALFPGSVRDCRAQAMRQIDEEF